MNCPEHFKAGEPVYCIVQNELKTGWIVRLLCDGYDVRAEVTTDWRLCRAVYSLPLDRIARRAEGQQ